MRDDTPDLRAPPHAVEAEQSVLGALLLSNAALDRIDDRVAGADFYAEAHRLIYAHIRDLIVHGRPADVVTVRDRLDAAGELEKVGGIAYLGELLANVPTAANVEHYAAIVRDKSVRRRLAALGMRCADLACARDGREASALIDDASREVEALANEGADADDPVPLHSLVPAIAADIEARAEQPDRLPGLSTGLPDLDPKLFGLHDGEVVVIAGATGQGKTTLGMHIALAGARAGTPCYVVSLEMKAAALATRAIANVGMVATHAMRSGRMSADDWERYADAAGRLSNAAPVLIDQSPRATIERIRARAKRAKRKHGVGLVVIDYLQLIEGSGGENRNQEVSRISRGVKTLAMELDCPVLLLSQLNREVGKRVNRRPIMSDLRDSGSVEQDADVILFVYRDEYYNPDNDDARGKAEIIIAKQREGETGTTYANFDGRHNRFAVTEWRPTMVHAPRSRGQGDLDA